MKRGQRTWRWSGIAIAGTALSLRTSSGCGRPATPLGDGSLTGALRKDWQEAPRPEGVLLRIIRPEIPLPWELLIQPAPEGAEPPRRAEWVELGEARVPGPQVRVGSEMRETTRSVRRYRKQFPDGRLLDALVDTRFPRRDSERFLDGLQPSSR